MDDSNAQILRDLLAHEPLFHRREFVHDVATFDRETSADFWEVGASGTVYQRDEVRAVLVARWSAGAPDSVETEHWRVTETRVTALGEGTFLLAYRLDQAGRHTRRASVWRRTGQEWQVRYHQGTLMA